MFGKQLEYISQNLMFDVGLQFLNNSSETVSQVERLSWSFFRIFIFHCFWNIGIPQSEGHRPPAFPQKPIHHGVKFSDFNNCWVRGFFPIGK